MEPAEELLRRSGRSSGNILVRSRMQARKYVVAEATEGYANYSRGYHQNRGHVRARRPIAAEPQCARTSTQAEHQQQLPAEADAGLSEEEHGLPLPEPGSSCGAEPSTCAASEVRWAEAMAAKE